MNAERKELSFNDLESGFWHLAALAEATRALLMEHGRAESDELLVNVRLNLQLLMEKATGYGNLISENI